MENVGQLSASVVRDGGDLSRQVLVDYATEDGGALARRDYVPSECTTLTDNDAHKIALISIIKKLKCQILQMIS